MARYAYIHTYTYLCVCVFCVCVCVCVDDLLEMHQFSAPDGAR